MSLMVVPCGLRGQQAEVLITLMGRKSGCKSREEALPDYVWIQGYDPVKVQVALSITATWHHRGHVTGILIHWAPGPYGGGHRGLTLWGAFTPNSGHSVCP